MMDRSFMGAELSLARPSSNEDGHRMVVSVRVKGAGKGRVRLVVIECSAEDFMLALTGRAALECNVRIRLPEVK